MYESVYSGEKGGHFRRLENNFIIGLTFRIGMLFDMGPEGLRGSRRAHPMGPGSTAGDLIGAVSRPTKRAPAENRRTAMNLSWALLAALYNGA